MPLMIDADPLLSLLANVDTANAGRQRTVALYLAHEQPNAARIERLSVGERDLGQRVRCCSMPQLPLGHAVVAAQQTE